MLCSAPTKQIDCKISCYFLFFFSFSGNEGLSTFDVTEDLSEMSLATPPMPSTYDTATVTRGELIAEAHKNLPSIRSMFVSSLQGTGRALDISRCVKQPFTRDLLHYFIFRMICTNWVWFLETDTFLTFGENQLR